VFSLHITTRLAISCILKLKNKMNMKNLIKYGFIAVVIFFCSCSETPAYNRKSEFRTIEYDGCEYIYSPYAGYKSLTHKGNCKNH